MLFTLPSPAIAKTVSISSVVVDLGTLGKNRHGCTHDIGGGGPRERGAIMAFLGVGTLETLETVETVGTLVETVETFRICFNLFHGLLVACIFN